ncbi:TPA: hypothetical protein ACFP41_000998 [Neisseria weaveri]
MSEKQSKFEPFVPPKGLSPRTRGDEANNSKNQHLRNELVNGRVELSLEDFDRSSFRDTGDKK